MVFLEANITLLDFDKVSKDEHQILILYLQPFERYTRLKFCFLARVCGKKR